MTDKAIVDLYWQREQAAIDESERKYGRYCFAIARNICGNGEDAEECVNDTWFASWNRMPDERPSALQGFFGVITRNTAINLFRRKTSGKRGGGQTELALDELQECIPAASSVEQYIELSELEQAIDSFVARLPETERNIFIARYWFMASITELAEEFGYSQSKAKTMLCRVRAKLKRYLQEEGLC